jgi:RNA polymerase sigma-70 factor (ECF subfamily)
MVKQRSTTGRWAHRRGETNLSIADARVIAALPRLRRLAHALTCDPARGDALARAAIAEAAADLDALEREARPDLRLYRILRRVWLDDPAELAPSAEPTTRAKVLRALSALPRHEREAVALVVIDELGYRDAAEVTGTTVAALTDHIVAGRQALASLLSEDPA